MHPLESDGGIAQLVRADDEDGALAVSKKTVADIPADMIQTEQDFRDFGGFAVEVWSYDPSLLSVNGVVDDISLLLSLDNHANERIQSGLDVIRKRYELPIKYEE